MKLVYTCPSCHTKLAGVEASDWATQVVTRTCRKCREQWQLKVWCLGEVDGMRLDAAEFKFRGRRPARPNWRVVVSEKQK